VLIQGVGALGDDPDVQGVSHDDNAGDNGRGISIPEVAYKSLSNSRRLYHTALQAAE
jgi:hypothetical protein